MGARRLRPPVAGGRVLGNLELLFGVAFAALLLREPLPPAHLVGGTLILAGVWLAVRCDGTVPLGPEPDATPDR